MDRSIYTYALIKSLYDQGQDYIDSFWPFAIKVMPVERFVEPLFIQRKTDEKFSFEIPLHVLELILSRAKSKNYLEKKDEKQYKLTQKGIEYLNKLETEKDVERRINELLEDIREYFQKRKVILNLDQINNLLSSFLQQNIEHFIEFINPSISVQQLSAPRIASKQYLLIEYIKLAEQMKPNNYDTLQEMVFGSIISVVLYVEDSSEIIEIRKRKFKHRQIFLDTNFIFSLLELRTPEFNEPAKELFNIVKAYGFDIKVFDFTLDEICRVINRYLGEAYRYPITVAVNTLYSSLKRKGWTETKVREFIAGIENILLERGIEIEWTNIDLENYVPQNKELGDLIKAYKPYQNLFNQNHDLVAIDKIREFRGKSIRRIEDSEACFITSDAKLSRFNFLEMGHKQNGTVCEIILDRLLTNILWLKDPTIKIPLKSIIAAHSRDLFIKRRIWDKFYDVLHELKKEGKIDTEKTSMLFYHGYIEDVLRDFDENEIDKISPEFALEEIEKATEYKEDIQRRQIEEIEKEKDKEIEIKIKKQEEQFLKQLEKKVSRKVQEKEKEWLDNIKAIKKNLRDGAKRSTGKLILIIRISFAILLAIPFVSCLIKKHWDAFQSYLGILSLILIIIGIVGISIKKVWEKSELKLFNNIYTKKIKEAGLHEHD